MALQVIIEPVEELSRTLVRMLESASTRSVGERGSFSLALPGGSVATAFFPDLARSAVDWSMVDFFWSDERAVPPDDPDSNYGVARPLLLDPVHARATRIHPMVAGSGDLDAAAGEYDATLTRVLGPGGVLDCSLLGVGPDGHVCSLFPGHRLLGEGEARVAAVVDSPKPPPRRITLTLPFVTASRLVIVAALGAAKAEVMAAAIGDPYSPLPVARVGREAQTCVFLLDPAAGSLRE